MSKRTLNDIANEVDTHERECAIRYGNIEKRLDEGNKRFVRIELLIVGLYATMASIEVLARVI
tara:strand:- start:342 stop:530 length:189 start_codon:yes stop_codon:yes gene_type:complete